jgi:hypothetical protein
MEMGTLSQQQGQLSSMCDMSIVVTEVEVMASVGQYDLLKAAVAATPDAVIAVAASINAHVACSLICGVSAQ